jgi:hypothetical protein
MSGIDFEPLYSQFVGSKNGLLFLIVNRLLPKDKRDWLVYKNVGDNFRLRENPEDLSTKLHCANFANSWVNSLNHGNMYRYWAIRRQTSLLKRSTFRDYKKLGNFINCLRYSPALAERLEKPLGRLSIHYCAI